MNVKRFLTMALLLSAVAVFLVACGGEGEVVEVTRVVEVEVPTEVTREVQVEVAGETTTTVEQVQVAVEFAGAGDTLKQIQDRGTLKCGGNANVRGFGYLDPDSGQFSGFDIDFCRAIAAAALGNADDIEVTPTTGTSRFPTLQSGEIDVLIRNSTHIMTRDTALGFDFAPITFYDGQGMMVRKDSGIASILDMDGATVCVQAGTTTEKNLADFFSANSIAYTPLVFPDAPSTLEAYDSGACNGFTTDKSGLVSQQLDLTEPDAHTILVEDMSREPLGPLTRHGDNNWNDIVSWTVLCTFNAEFLGIDQSNVDSFLGGDDPVVTDLLGETGGLGQNLGLNNDFCYQVIKQVGSYLDIYNRNLGPDTPFNLPRGLNALYNDGGILYPTPFK